MSLPLQTAVPHIGGALISRADLRRDLVALAWMDVDAQDGRRHLAVPSDLFLLTVYCDESLVCGESHEARDLEIVVSVLRSRPVEFASTGHGQLALALLTPRGLLKLLRAPLNGMMDRRLPLAQFCGRAEQHRLRDLLRDARTRHQRLMCLGSWLESRMAQRHGFGLQQARAARAATLLQNLRRPLLVPELSDKLDVTRRQLERDFEKWLGTSPAFYGRLVRFQRAAGAVADGRRIVDVASEGGYADQPHLARTFRELGAMTPGDLAVATALPWRLHERAAFGGRLIMLDAPSSDVEQSDSE
jgi:AraC-like DNA-binding protein